jgi:hypothetical protein
MQARAHLQRSKVLQITAVELLQRRRSRRPRWVWLEQVVEQSIIAPPKPPIGKPQRSLYARTLALIRATQELQPLLGLALLLASARINDACVSALERCVAVLFDSVDIEGSGRVGLGLIGSEARDNIAAEVGAGGRVGQIQCFAEQRAQEAQQFGL